MKSIRFRGWSNEHQQWFYGYYAIIHEVVTDNHNSVTKVVKHHCIFNDKIGERTPSGYWNEVEPSTVGRMFSIDYGWKARATFFEGDILLVRWMDDKNREFDRCECIARWDDDICALYFEDLHDSSKRYEVRGEINVASMIHIVGNIYGKNESQPINEPNKIEGK